MDYAKKNNIEIAGIYLDVGCHGRTMDRPGLQSVIQTLKEGNADVILVANYNRLYRGRFPQELQELPVVSLKEQNRKRERGGKEHDISSKNAASLIPSPHEIFSSLLYKKKPNDNAPTKLK